jgi:voltage-gated potassium channel
MIQVERILSLRKSSLFDSVSLEKVSILAESLSERSFSSSECIVKEDDDCTSLYIIAKGSVRVSYCGMDAIVGEYGFFGELGIFHDEIIPLSASAEGDVLVFEIDGDLYRKVMAEEFDVADNLLRSLVRGIISLAEKNQKESS